MRESKFDQQVRKNSIQSITYPTFSPSIWQMFHCIKEQIEYLGRCNGFDAVDAIIDRYWFSLHECTSWNLWMDWRQPCGIDDAGLKEISIYWTQSVRNKPRQYSPWRPAKKSHHTYLVLKHIISSQAISPFVTIVTSRPNHFFECIPPA